LTHSISLSRLQRRGIQELLGVVIEFKVEVDEAEFEGEVDEKGAEEEDEV